jgi:hypothetical protein
MLGLAQASRGNPRPQRLAVGRSRPSPVARRKALRRQIFRHEYSLLSTAHRLSSKIRSLYEQLLNLAA